VCHKTCKHPSKQEGLTDNRSTRKTAANTNTNGDRNNNKEQHRACNGETNGNNPETQTGLFQWINNRNDNQQIRGSGNNRPDHKQKNLQPTWAHGQKLTTHQERKQQQPAKQQQTGAFSVWTGRFRRKSRAKHTTV